MIVHRMFRGDDHTLTVESDVSLADASELTFTVRRRLRDESPMQIQKTLTLGEVVVGVEDTDAEVTLEPNDTIDLEPGMYAWDLEVTDAYGLIHTAAYGRLHVKADVTHAEVS